MLCISYNSGMQKFKCLILAYALALFSGAANSQDVVPSLPVNISIIGNSFSGGDTAGNDTGAGGGNYVPLTCSGIAVSSDGTVCTVGNFNEQFSPVQLFKSGKWVASHWFQSVGGNAAGYDRETDTFLVANVNNSSIPPVITAIGSKGEQRADVPWYQESNPRFWLHRISEANWGGRGSGVAAGKDLVYTAYRDEGQIRVLDKRKGKNSEGYFKGIPCVSPGALALDPDEKFIWNISGEGVNAVVVALDINTGRELNRLVLSPGSQPTGLAIDGLGRLLVSDAGPQNNIKVFDKTGKRVATWGVTGGIFTGAYPGRLRDGYLEHPQGVGVDGEGNLYVLDVSRSFPQRVSIESHKWLSASKTWSVKDTWEVHGCIFADSVVVDPTNTSVLYSSLIRFTADWSKKTTDLSAPAVQAKPVSTTVNPDVYPQDARLNIFAQGGAMRTAYAVRVIGGRKFLYSGLTLEISRFGDPGKGDVATPCSFFIYRDPRIDYALGDWPINRPDGLERNENSLIWRDSNRDGLPTADEYSSLDRGGADRQWLDSESNVWFFPELYRRTGSVYLLDGLKDDSPYYPEAKKKKFVLPGQGIYGDITLTRVGDNGTLYVASRKPGDGLWLSSWKGFSQLVKSEKDTSTLAPSWSIHLSDGMRLDDFFGRGQLTGGIQPFKDYIFVADASGGGVRVLKASDGSVIGRMDNPKLMTGATMDNPGMLGVFYRAGEYIITVTDYLHNKIVCYRWKP